VDGFPIDGSPELIRRQCLESLAALRTETIDLYQLHWPDPGVPLAESVGALAELQREGKVRMIGMSNLSPAQLDEAVSAGPIVSVQNQFSPAHPDWDVLEKCAALDLAYLAYSPVGGSAGALDTKFPELRSLAERWSLSSPELVLAWELTLSSRFIPISGVTREASARSSAAAARLQLTGEQISELSGVLGKATQGARRVSA
jgi:aryl-alcohol dehydrogenase-like predicted oxidoreductase